MTDRAARLEELAALVAAGAATSAEQRELDGLCAGDAAA
jgi:hypothetical protein